MKKIRLSGREVAVVRALGFGLPLSGGEVLEHTRLQPEDLVDVLNGLMDVGYIEMTPHGEHTNVEGLPAAQFEVNSSYTHEIKVALGLDRSYAEVEPGSRNKRRNMK